MKFFNGGRSGMLIGFSGVAQSGKNSCADILCAEHGFQQTAFADPLREAMLRLNPYIDQNVRLASTVERYGWEFAKKYPECRALMQRMGTEVGRELFGQNFWVDLCLSKINGETDVAITDVRFKSEASAIKANGGKLVRITRTGFGPINGHRSETELDDYAFDAYINNDGSLPQLSEKVNHAMQGLR
jgi:hypothetical protein